MGSEMCIRDRHLNITQRNGNGQVSEEYCDCETCQGTGIGQYGDPNTSRCSDCNGRGYFIFEEDEDE